MAFSKRRSKRSARSWALRFEDSAVLAMKKKHNDGEEMRPLAHLENVGHLVGDVVLVPG